MVYTTRQGRDIVMNGLLQDEDEVLLRMVCYDKTRKIQCYEWSIMTARGRDFLKNSLL